VRAARPGLARRRFHFSPFRFLSSLLPTGIRLQRQVRAKAALCHRHGHPPRVRYPSSATITRDRLWRQRRPRSSLADEAHCPLRRRGEGCAREGPAPFWSFPRRGAGARAPQATRRNHSHRLRASTIGLSRASPCTREGETERRGFPLAHPFRARCAVQWAAASRVGLAPLSVINGSKHSRQWWATQRRRRPLTHVN